MNTTSTILKSLILPLVIKFSKGDVNTLPDTFWNQFAADFIRFEIDSTPIYSTLYQLELQNPEAVFEKLPQAYTSFIKELAEEYVLGNQSEISEQLLENKNETFLQEVAFLKTMKAVITKVERNQLKKDLPILYDRLAFELDEEILKQVAKKKSREDLRTKFKQWDEELVEEETVLMETNYSKIEEDYSQSIETHQMEIPQSKLISLSWMKYINVAAILVIGFLVWQPNKSSNDELFAQYTSDNLDIKFNNVERSKVGSGSIGVRGNEILFGDYTALESDIAQEAIYLFINGKFEKSKKIFYELNPKGKNNEILFLLSIAELKTNSVKDAILNLEYLKGQENFKSMEEVKFYLAICYIKENKKTEAKELLNQLIKENGKFTSSSKDILSELRWF